MEAPGAWTPLRERIFRALWLASLASNIGSWMHDASAAWMMTTLSPSPLLVALMQTASTLPFFLLALPAGALADVVDRRRVLLATQSWMLAAAAALGVLTLAGAVSPVRLLGLTFALGLGNAMNAPAWQAVVPELVSRAELPAAVALNGIAVNVARAVGPALGGVLVAALGPGPVFLLNAASFLGVVLVLAGWRTPAPSRALPGEALVGAMRAGARYARHAMPLRTVLARIGIFILPASAVWALLPVVARHGLDLGAVGYGVLLGCLGAGAVVGAFLLPWARRHMSIDRLLALATVVFALATAAVAVLPRPLLAGLALLAGGGAWITAMASLSVTAQYAVPAWVRARALALSLLVIQGGMAAGGLLWGTIATHAGVPTALLAAAVGLVAGLAVAGRHVLAGLEQLDLTPTMHWAQPAVSDQPEPDRGPVLVTVEYRIDPGRSEEFSAVMHHLGRLRRRDGAVQWALFRDASDPARFVETFLVASWIEHLRQHERVTAADRDVEERARAFQVNGAPVVSHLIAEPPPPRGR